MADLSASTFSVVVMVDGSSSSETVDSSLVDVVSYDGFRRGTDLGGNLMVTKGYLGNPMYTTSYGADAPATYRFRKNDNTAINKKKIYEGK